MKLSILIPQYNETNEQIKSLLDSIQIQELINLKDDIEVIIGNDGSDIHLTEDFLKQYSFHIQYHFFKHGRLAATREKLFKLSKADYVMFCDADDMFLSNIALSVIFQYISDGFDILSCDFYEQLPKDDKFYYLPHRNSSVFVHGKVYNKQFLLHNEIHWHEELHEHQDSPFNVLAMTCAKNTKICEMPLYLWKYNENSVSRSNGDMHMPKTTSHFIDSINCLIQDLKDRGYGEQACYQSKYGLYLFYYEMLHDCWDKEEAQKYKNEIYMKIAKFYKDKRLMIEKVSEERTKEIIELTEKKALKHGPLNKNKISFEDWLSAILLLYKGA